VDIFFISYKEHNREENWSRLCSFHPDSKRIHGFKGIDTVHLICDTNSSTSYFWTVDGDNWLTKPLEADPYSDLILYKAIDPLHNTPTLLGGVKLWRKGAMVNKNMDKGDFSLNATDKKVISEEIFSITRYNTSAFDAWKTSFRHCVKLMSVIFKSRPNASNIDNYIKQWADTKNSMEANSMWSYKGYTDAIEYVNLHDDNMSELNKINDYDWLELYFGEKYGTP
jgi:hypothetical protein